MTASALPAWSQQFEPGVLGPAPVLGLSDPITREWAWGGARGAGVNVAVIDSGIDSDHPRVGRVDGAVAVEIDPESPTGTRCDEGPHDDRYGHGTACAGIIRAIAPEASLHSVRVLGANLKGTGLSFIAGLRWALDHGMHVMNLSLSTRSRDHFAALHELVDEACFRGAMLVCAVNNVEAPSFPSQFSSVISVAARPHPCDDLLSIAYNPAPPVEFGASGVDVDVAWVAGRSMRVTGNSFAAAHVTGMVTRILSKHPGLTPFQMKTVLAGVADNAG
jgi:subtilisin family serine protease